MKIPFKIFYKISLLLLIVSSCSTKEKENTNGFPYNVKEDTKDRKLSSAIDRAFNQLEGYTPATNELYTNFMYTPLKGLDYNNGDGTISRRDPSKIIKENGKYYIWYTHRQTSTPPVGARNAAQSNDTIPSTDWDLAEIWYATSKDGFTWNEQGVAVARPPKPQVGWRSVATTDILKWEGKYYLYFQGFLEASGKKGDHCPVAVASSDSPDGPWTYHEGAVIENGAEGTWDQFAIHDPNPFVHNGKIYIYYKAAFNRPDNLWIAAGLAIADTPLGPFKKHPLNPLFNSGHETSLFPFKEGIAALIVQDGVENNTIQYAKDWVNFEIASVSKFMPVASGPYIPDAFLDNKNGRGITWGLSHFVNAGERGKQHSILARFDCDLSLDVHDPQMKKKIRWLKPDFYFKHKLNKKQLDRIKASNN